MIKLKKRLFNGKMSYPGIYYSNRHNKWVARVKVPLGYKHIAWKNSEQEAVTAVEDYLNSKT